MIVGTNWFFKKLFFVFHIPSKTNGGENVCYISLSASFDSMYHHVSFPLHLSFVFPLCSPLPRAFLPSSFFLLTFYVKVHSLSYTCSSIICGYGCGYTFIACAKTTAIAEHCFPYCDFGLRHHICMFDFLPYFWGCIQYYYMVDKVLIDNNLENGWLNHNFGIESYC